MIVFVCAGCGAELSAPLSQVALPVHSRQRYGNGVQLPVLMETGTFAMEPESGGLPWRREKESDPDGAVVVAPGDVRGTVLVPERDGGHCCGLDGADGPNMACEACGLLVASRVDDCSLWQAVWFVPDAIRRHPVADADAGTGPLSWADLMADGSGTPPYAAITSWGGSRPGLYHWWSWNPQWEAAAGRALAHLLAASEGRPVSVPHGLTREVFQRTLDVLLCQGAPSLRAALAGPGLPAPDADILLVPDHPQTGAIWTPEGGLSARLVPLPFGVWLWLAFPEPHLPADPAPEALPGDVLRDDPPSPRPCHLFRIDSGVFQHTLARLPTAHAPWLLEVLDNLKKYVGTSLF
ncbi:hypothetical protein CJI59_15050 [Streptomyces sp. Alain-F2R5]|nr:hypothetical protein [Streptomyces sp. Alain-F2R5]PAN00806.1 hypothetical protein CJI59_15050 [Streptomyces sp. Alain-F2R5]